MCPIRPIAEEIFWGALEAILETFCKAFCYGGVARERPVFDACKTCFTTKVSLTMLALASVGRPAAVCVSLWA